MASEGNEYTKGPALADTDSVSGKRGHESPQQGRRPLWLISAFNWAILVLAFVVATFPQEKLEELWIGLLYNEGTAAGGLSRRRQSGGRGAVRREAWSLGDEREGCSAGIGLPKMRHQAGNHVPSENGFNGGATSKGGSQSGLDA